MINKTFDFLTQEVSIKFQKITAYTSHGPSIGGYREAVIKELIDNFISERFTICTGFVYDAENERSSNQMDILIVDENYPSAYFLKTSDFIIADKDAVVCAIEIKSTFNKAILKDISQKCASIKNISKDIDFLAFCFDSQVKHKNITQTYRKLQLSESHYSDHITIYSLGFIVKREEKGSSYHQMHWDTTADSRSTNLKMFLSHIMNLCFIKCGIEDNQYSKYKPKILLNHPDKFEFKT